jgi:glycerol-3-phosphate dehydrogenase subunit C
VTATFDPHDPAYLEEAEVRDELTRTFEVCRDCRACVERCAVFPTLFGLLDAVPQHDPGLLTPAEQDAVVDECYHCNRCTSDCPYTPDRHSVAIDMPRLVLRAAAMRMANGQRSILDQLVAGPRTRLAGIDRLSGRPERSSRASGTLAALVDRFGGHRLGEWVAAPTRRERFSTWFARRESQVGEERRGHVGIVPTCLVEYGASGIGRDLVRVFEHAGIECHVSASGCCGAPWLHAGDIGRFGSMADHNVGVLAREIRSGALEGIVVVEPTCRSVMEREYPAHVAASNRSDAALVVEHLTDPSAQLLRSCSNDSATGVELVVGLVGGDGAAETGAVRVRYHLACHARTAGDRSPGLDLLGALGVDVAAVDACAGIGGRWDRRGPDWAEPAPSECMDSTPVDVVTSQSSHADVVVVGDCSLANQAIGEASGSVVVHPLSLIARLCGLADGDVHKDGSDEGSRGAG